MRLDTSTATLRTSHGQLIYTKQHGQGSTSLLGVPWIPEQVVLCLPAELQPWLPCTSLAAGKQGGGGEHSHMTDEMSTAAPLCEASCAQKSNFMVGGQCCCHCPSAGLEEGRDQPGTTSTPIQPGDFPVRGRGSTWPSSPVLTVFCWCVGSETQILT